MYDTFVCLCSSAVASGAGTGSVVVVDLVARCRRAKYWTRPSAGAGRGCRSATDEYPRLDVDRERERVGGWERGLDVPVSEGTKKNDNRCL
jgi:hypothetical protein